MSSSSSVTSSCIVSNVSSGVSDISIVSSVSTVGNVSIVSSVSNVMLLLYVIIKFMIKKELKFAPIIEEVKRTEFDSAVSALIDA